MTKLKGIVFIDLFQFIPEVDKFIRKLSPTFSIEYKEKDLPLLRTVFINKILSYSELSGELVGNFNSSHLSVLFPNSDINDIVEPLSNKLYDFLIINGISDDEYIVYDIGEFKYGYLNKKEGIKNAPTMSDKLQFNRYILSKITDE